MPFTVLQCVNKDIILLSYTNCTTKMLTIYSPHISKVLPLSLTMAITTIFDITSYDFP